MASTNSQISSRQGFTLVEVLVTTTVSGFVMAGLLTAYVFVARNIVHLDGAVEFDNRARLVLALFTRDVSAATAVTVAEADEVTFTLPGGTVSYVWDASADTFSRISGGNTVVLLRESAAIPFTFTVSLGYYSRSGTLADPAGGLQPIFIKQAELTLTGLIKTSGINRVITSARQVLASTVVPATDS